MHQRRQPIIHPLQILEHHCQVQRCHGPFQMDAQDTRGQEHNIRQAEQPHLEVEMTPVIEYLTLQTIINKVDSSLFEGRLVLKAAYHCQSVIQFLEIFVLFPIKFG